MSTGWEGILDEGEKILWQGRPDSGFYLEPWTLIPAAFGLFFSGFALFWMIGAASAGGGFWAFGLIHFGFGLFIIANSLFGPVIRRRHTWYTLTNRRAFIATDLPWQGKRLKSYPIDKTTQFEHLPGNGLETTYFATEERRGSKGRSYTVKIGFERVEDGEVAWKLLREVARGEHA